MAFPLFCDRCGADYPERRSMSAFGLLGLPLQFEQDTDALDRCEVMLSQRLHPDLWSARSEAGARKALLAQSAVNEALGAIRDPFVRAETLLTIYRLDRTDDLGSTQALPTPFLIEQLELQEEIVEGVDPERKRELSRLIRSELSALRSTLSEAFSAFESGQHDTALGTAREAADRSRYWRNAQRSLRGEVPQ